MAISSTEKQSKTASLGYTDHTRQEVDIVIYDATNASLYIGRPHNE